MIFVTTCTLTLNWNYHSPSLLLVEIMSPPWRLYTGTKFLPLKWNLSNYDRVYIAIVYTVLPNLCSAAHKCAARAVEVCRGWMSEIKSFQWEVSMKFSIVIENVWCCKFSHGTLLPLHHNIIIWSLNRSSVIIFDALFRLSLHGHCLSSLDRHALRVLQSRTTIIAQHRAHASFKVESDITRRCFWAFVNFIWC